jgi:predicted nuclease with TOPRIM domain
MGNYFYGNEISDYGKKHKKVDYATLARSFNHVQSGYLLDKYWEEQWEVINGYREYYEDNEENMYTYDEAQARIDELREEQEELDENSDRYAEIEEDIEQLESVKFKDYFQYFIISASGAEILSKWTDEYVIYNSELDLYIWGVDHCGTSWEYVLTEIECRKGE